MPITILLPAVLEIEDDKSDEYDEYIFAGRNGRYVSRNEGEPYICMLIYMYKCTADYGAKERLPVSSE